MIKIKRHLSRKEWNLLIICTIMIVIILSNITLRGVRLKFARLREEISLTEARLGGLNRILKERAEIESRYDKAVAGLPFTPEGKMRGLRQIKGPDDFFRQIEGLARLEVRDGDDDVVEHCHLLEPRYLTSVPSATQTCTPERR